MVNEGSVFAQKRGLEHSAIHSALLNVVEFLWKEYSISNPPLPYPLMGQEQGPSRTKDNEYK